MGEASLRWRISFGALYEARDCAAPAGAKGLLVDSMCQIASADPRGGHQQRDIPMVGAHLPQGTLATGALRVELIDQMHCGDGVGGPRFGQLVVPVVARKLARDPLTRSQTAAAELARAGTLSATLRIPGAAGPVSVVADLRMAQIRTSVQVEAPPDGGGMRRINWILRQLTEAPDSLAVEVLFARREQTSCEQLKDARSNPAALLPDPAAEVRAFRLSACAPMGTKRIGLSKAFVPSVKDAVDAFYARVLQGLRPAPPRMPADAAAEAIDAVERAVDA